MRRQRELQLNRDTTRHLIPPMIAAMIFLATLATAGSFAVDAVVDHWTNSVEGTLTVQIPGLPNSKSVEMEERITKVVSLLVKERGIKKTRTLSLDETITLLEPWLEPEIFRTSISIPRIIDVALDNKIKMDINSLAGRLKSLVPGTRITNNERFLGRIIRLAYLMQIVGGAVIIVVTFAAIAITMLATRTSLAMHTDTIELLHLIGAQDSYIARAFVQQALISSALGSLVGLLAGLVVIVVSIFLYLGIPPRGLPEIELGLTHWLILLLLPVGATTVASLTARVTVMKSLQRLR